MKPTLSISTDLNREKGYTIVTVSGIKSHVDRLYYSVSRDGHDLKYVGEKAWQAVFEWLEPVDARYEHECIKFVMPPSVTRQMETQDYVLALKVYPTAEDIFIDFFWPDILPSASLGQPETEDKKSEARVKPAVEIKKSAPIELPTVSKPAAPAKDPHVKEVTPQINESKTKKSIDPGVAAIVGIALLVVFAGAIYWTVSSMSSGSEEPVISTARPKPVAENKESNLESDLNTPSKSSLPNNEDTTADSNTMRTEPVSKNAPPTTQPADKPTQDIVDNKPPEPDETVDKLKALLSHGEKGEEEDSRKFKSIESALREKLNE